MRLYLHGARMRPTSGLHPSTRCDADEGESGAGRLPEPPDGLHHTRIRPSVDHQSAESIEHGQHAPPQCLGHLLRRFE
jgi:hypothetical protein